MAAVLLKNQSEVPFFGDKMNFITGLDPLGHQNASAKAYSTMLPGLNNVTGQIRAYAFYCWLLSEYANIIESTDPKAQKQFVRRAEYIIALLSHHVDIDGISGRQYASNRFNEGLSSFDLQTGTYQANGTTTRTYWQFHFGVFGQYYLGSMRQIGLIEEPVDAANQPMGLYRRTPKKEGLPVSGETLAAAFDENIDPDNKRLFLDCIARGEVHVLELEQLAVDFNLRKINPATAESQFMIDLLCSVDEPGTASETPTTYRKQTIKHVLAYALTINHPFSSRDFIIQAYRDKGMNGESEDACLTGWYYYQLNEYWQYSGTAILNGLLDYIEKLRGPGWIGLQELLHQVTVALQTFLETTLGVSGKVSIQDLLNSIDEDAHSLYQTVENSRDIERIGYALLLLLALYKENEAQANRLREYISLHQWDIRDDFLDFMRAELNNLDQPIDDFIPQFLLNKVIHRHILVAYRKMGSGSQSTEKFLLEDNKMRVIGNFDPAFTGPRLGNLLTFLNDLELLKLDGKLTTSGTRLLIQLAS